VGFEGRCPYRYQSRSRCSALLCPSSCRGGRDFRRKANKATQSATRKIEPVRAILRDLQPRQRPAHRCSGNICWNDSVKYAFASPTELQTRRPSSCRPQCRATHLPSAPQYIAPNTGPSSVMWMDRSRRRLSGAATAHSIANRCRHRSQRRRCSSTTSRLAADDVPRS
jgi:hypothetical protein